MKTYILDFLPKLQKYSQKLDDITILKDQHWISIDTITDSKSKYIFRDNKELLISTNGKVRKAKWDYIDNKSLLIDIDNESFLLKHGFIDDNILALKLDDSEEFAVFVNQNKFPSGLDSIDRVKTFLEGKYKEGKLPIGPKVNPIVELIESIGFWAVVLLWVIIALIVYTENN